MCQAIHRLRVTFVSLTHTHSHSKKRKCKKYFRKFIYYCYSNGIELRFVPFFLEHFNSHTNNSTTPAYAFGWDVVIFSHFIRYHFRYSAVSAVHALWIRLRTSLHIYNGGNLNGIYNKENRLSRFEKYPFN